MRTLFKVVKAPHGRKQMLLTFKVQGTTEKASINFFSLLCLAEQPLNVFRTIMFYGNKLYVFKTFIIVLLSASTKQPLFKLVELIGMHNWRVVRCIHNDECLRMILLQLKFEAIILKDYWPLRALSMSHISPSSSVFILIRQDYWRCPPPLG